MERLQKAIARAGLASRREAEEWIAAGRVSVNGEVVTTPGLQVDPSSDKVTVDGQALPDRPAIVSYAFHKPRNVLVECVLMVDLYTPTEGAPERLPRMLSFWSSCSKRGTM